jgi:hypothetical protein
MEHTGGAMESPLLLAALRRGRLALRAQLGAARAGHARARRGPAPQTSASKQTGPTTTHEPSGTGTFTGTRERSRDTP